MVARLRPRALALPLSAAPAPYVALALVAASLRLALLDYVEFKGDEAQVAGTVRDMLETGHLVQTGMITSVGPLNPPLFDYLMAIPLALSSDPRVTTAFVGVVNVAAVLVTYALAARLWERAGARSRWAPFVPALLFAVAPWAVIFSRKIWAPELEPFFAACCLLGILQARAGEAARWWVALALASWLWMCQLHPAALLLAPVFLLAGPSLWRQIRPAPVALGLLAGLLPLLPYLRYDAAHGWENARGFLHAAGQPPTQDLTSVLFAFMDVTSLDTLQLEGVPYTHFTTFGSLFSLHSDAASAIMAVAIAAVIGTCAAGFARACGSRERHVAGDLLVLLGWFWLPVLFTIRHATPLFQHYYLILFPSSFLLIGFGISVIGGWLAREPAPATESRPPSASPPRSSRAPMVPVAPWRPAVAVAAVAFLVAGWLALVASLYAYLPTGKSVADFGVPLKTTMGMAALARKAAGDGQLWLVVGDDTAPMLTYLLRAERSSAGSSPQRLPRDALVLPPAGDSAGYLLDDAALPAARALQAAGAMPVGLVSFPGSTASAIGLAWRTGSTPRALATPLQPVAVRLANGVEFLGVGTSLPAPNLLRVEYVWRVGLGGTDVTGADLALYTHVVNAAGTMVAQKDGMPYPSARWEAGETMAAWFDVPLDGVPAGRYELRSGMYARPSIQRVPMVDDNGQQRDGEFSLGSMTLG